MDIQIIRTEKYDPPVEFVERKGAGHPDTICDALAEGLARDLAAYYLEEYETLRHFNVDKALLSAGQVRAGYGRGEVVKPSRIILAGKVDARGGFPPLGRLTRKAYDRLADILPWASLPGDYAIELQLNPSSEDLLPLLELGVGGEGAPLSNDTSFAVVSAPRSALEAAVHDIERRLASESFRAEVPVGADIKVMGYRNGDVVRMTVAAAILARRVQDFGEYCAAKDRIREAALETAQAAFDAVGRHVSSLEVNVNQADLDEDSVYLTLTGSSAEAGDDGQVGRGNRVGGLITPHRSMSLEAACGKNPAGHVGKLYHAVAWEIAAAVLGVEGVNGATVRMLSEIGRPVDDPVAVQLELSGTFGPSTDEMVQALVCEKILGWRDASRKLMEGGYELY